MSLELAAPTAPKNPVHLDAFIFRVGKACLRQLLAWFFFPYEVLRGLETQPGLEYSFLVLMLARYCAQRCTSAQGLN